MDRPGGGFAAGDIGEVRAITGKQSPGIGCSYDAFFGTANGIKAYWAHILITHEMVNLFTGQVVSGGWPVDWWANHRSPFPLMTAVEIEYALVPQMAVFHERQGREDPLVGCSCTSRTSSAGRCSARRFARPSTTGSSGTRSAPIRPRCARPMLPPIFRSARPEDIGGILEPLVPGYDAQAVKDIVRARSHWASMSRQSTRRRASKAAFLKGDYRAALK